MIILKNVTLMAIATQSIEATAEAIRYSCKDIQFGNVRLVSPYAPDNMPSYCQWDRVQPFESIDQWNHYVFYHQFKHFDTSHSILVHSDGFIVNPHKWQNSWLEYDYIGSPWSAECAVAIQGGRDQPIQRVGNSVSLRSRKICSLPSALGIPWTRYNGDYNEDTQMSAHNWRYMQEAGVKMAPIEVAVEWGREEDIPEGHHVVEPFVFHKWTGRNSIYPRF